MKFLIIPLFLVGCSGVDVKEDIAPTKPERPTITEYIIEAEGGRIVKVIDKGTYPESEEVSKPLQLHPIWLFIGFIILSITITHLSIMMDKRKSI